MSSQLGFLCGCTPAQSGNLQPDRQPSTRDIKVHPIARFEGPLDGESNEHLKRLARPKQHVRAIERKMRPVLIDLITDESLENGAAALKIIS